MIYDHNNNNNNNAEVLLYPSQVTSSKEHFYYILRKLYDVWYVILLPLPKKLLKPNK